MTTRLPCSRCATTRDIEVTDREEKVTIKGKEVSFLAHFSRCTTCGEEFEGPGQLDANLDAAREAYARLYESPTPDALVALRARYGASQKAFGSILGFGELTMNGYEQGGTPILLTGFSLSLRTIPVFSRRCTTSTRARSALSSVGGSKSPRVIGRRSCGPVLIP